MYKWEGGTAPGIVALFCNATVLCCSSNTKETSSCTIYAAPCHDGGWNRGRKTGQQSPSCLDPFITLLHGPLDPKQNLAMMPDTLSYVCQLILQYRLAQINWAVPIS